MKPTVRIIAGYVLFSADIFILFLLFFEARMVFPPWLQSVGRMHPLFLHFPIVILLIAMSMELFRFQTGTISGEIYQNIKNVFLMAGALSASVTVIMGLLLAKEPGYNGRTLDWHKWIGVSIVFISTLIYLLKDRNWYNPPLAKTIALFSLLCIIVGSHFGAEISHGADFISGPLITGKKTEKIPLEKAVIFKDIVQSILVAKCSSCHNPDKSKGNLVLDKEEDLIRGGKNGKLFIPGDAENSLIIRRIHLPEEEKKHMPLSGKPQLSDSEKDLLYKWIQAGADFKVRVIDLSESDSLRIAASKFLQPAEDLYTFQAAAEKTIQGLNNNYRVVFPIAEESPALVVDFFNKSQFSSKALEELLAVKTQIIELNLNKMPVMDADLKTIAKFENLRTLNLNFTNISTKGLGELSVLKNLKRLSLSGTATDSRNLQLINQLRNLKELFVWNTGLKAEEIDSLQKEYPAIRFIKGFPKDAPPIPLNTPILLTANSVFTDTLHLRLKHAIPNTQIRYTLDGRTPDSVNSFLYKNDVVIDRTLVFKARAFKETWLGSDSVMYDFYKSQYKPDSIFFITNPADSYKGNGAITLIDHITGELGFTSGKWLGFQKDMMVGMEFFHPVLLHSVSIHLLKNIGADIYPPTEIQIWGGYNPGHLKLLQTVHPAVPLKGDIPSIFLGDCKFPPIIVRYLKVTASSVKKVPKFGTSPGKPGWVFADEILLN